MATSEQIISSEGVYDFNCTPCMQRERFSEARKFCVECGEYFCSTCLSCHEHFGATKGHTLIDCKDVSIGHAVTLLAKCKIHVNKEEDMVCGEHDVVCCRVCIATNHRSCQDIDYLPEAAQNFRDSEKRAALGNDVKNKIGELQTSYKGHITRAVQLKVRKKTLLKRLQLFRVSTTELIENLVTEAKTNIEKTYEPAVCNTHTHIRTTDNLLSRFNILSRDLANENDPISLYKKALECKRALRETKIMHCALDEKMTETDEVLTGITETVKKSISDDRFLGVIRMSELGTDTCVPNMCMLSNSSFCLAKYAENKITHLDENLKIVGNYEAESKVWGICPINESEIAFTMPVLMKVQFLAFDRKPVLKTCFSTKIPCRGIAYCNENIYVAGGGFQGEESGQIHTYDLKGKLLYRFEQDSDGKCFSIPRCLVANNEYIYVTDCQNGVICLDLYGKRKWVYTNSKLQYPWGICFTPNANLLIAGFESSNIVVVSKDGELFGELLKNNDGISTPRALVIDVPNSRLLVTTSKGSVLKMFEFEDLEI